MRLNDWMKEEGLNQEQCAARLGISQGHVSKLVRGRPRVSAAIALSIEEATGGAVTARDLVSVSHVATPITRRAGRERPASRRSTRSATEKRSGIALPRKNGGHRE